jgi:hypothetical protein
MGLFTRNTMTIDAMTDLVAYSAMMILGMYQRTGQWPDGACRTEIINRRLDQTGHQASLWKLSKIALVADHVARYLAADELTLTFITETLGDGDTREHIASLSRTALFQAGITD